MVLRRAFQAEFHTGRLLAVIGVSGENFLRPVDLFHEHDAGKHVGPCRRAERQHQICALTVLRRQTAGATDQKRDITSLIAPCAKFIGEVLTAERFAAFVHGNPHGPLGKGCGQQVTFAGFELCGREFASFFNFHDLKWPLHAFLVFIDQVALRARF